MFVLFSVHRFHAAMPAQLAWLEVRTRAHITKGTTSHATRTQRSAATENRVCLILQCDMEAQMLIQLLLVFQHSPGSRGEPRLIGN